MKPSKRTTEPTARSVAVRRPVRRLDLDRRALDLGRLHLAGDGALPDHLVEPRLVGIEVLVAPESGVRKKSVGRIASCASCAFLALVV